MARLCTAIADSVSAAHSFTSNSFRIRTCQDPKCFFWIRIRNRIQLKVSDKTGSGSTSYNTAVKGLGHHINISFKAFKPNLYGYLLYILKWLLYKYKVSVCNSCNLHSNLLAESASFMQRRSCFALPLARGAVKLKLKARLMKK